MARKTFTEVLGEASFNQLLKEFNHVKQLREEIEQQRMKEWWPYTEWLKLYHRAIFAAIKNDWQDVSVAGALANCERYPEHLKTTLLCNI